MRASTASIGSTDSPLSLMQRSIHFGSHSRDALQLQTAVTALGHIGLLGEVLEDELATRRLHLSHLVGLRAEAVTTAVGQTLNHDDAEEGGDEDSGDG